jgi:hypothetical protein
MDVLDREWGALPEGALIEKSPSTRIEKAKPWAVILEDASAESVELFFYLPSLPLFAERRLALELLVNTLLHDEEARFQLVLKEAYRGRFPPRIWLNMGGPGRLEDRDSQVTEIQLSLDARVTPGLVARLWEVFSAWAGEEIKPEQLLRAKVRVRDRFESLLGEAVELNLGLLFAEPPVQKDFSFLDRLESVTMGELDSLRSHFGADAFKGLSFWGPSDEVRPLFESIFGVERVRMEGTLK